jgi:hypothetical protein
MAVAAELASSKLSRNSHCSRVVARICMRLRDTFLLLFVVLHTSLGADSKRLLKPDDFAVLRDVDEPNVSPDGQTIAYVVGTVDLKKAKQPKISGSRNGTAQKTAPLLSVTMSRHIRAGVRTASGSPSFQVARTKTTTTSFGFSPAPAAKRNN